MEKWDEVFLRPGSSTEGIPPADFSKLGQVREPVDYNFGLRGTNDFDAEPVCLVFVLWDSAYAFADFFNLKVSPSRLGVSIQS